MIKVVVRHGAFQQCDVAGRERAAHLSLKCAFDDGRAAACMAGADERVDERDEVVGQPNGDLRAHPIMV